MIKLIITLVAIATLNFMVTNTMANNIANYHIANNIKNNIANSLTTNSDSLKKQQEFNTTNNLAFSKKLNFWQKIKYNFVKTKLTKFLKKYHEQKNNSDAIKTDPLAIVSLAFGGIAVLTLFVAGGLSLLFALVAIVTGIISLVKIKKSKGKLGGKTMAILGLVLGGTLFLLVIAAITYFLSIL